MAVVNSHYKSRLSARNGIRHVTLKKASLARLDMLRICGSSRRFAGAGLGEFRPFRQRYYDGDLLVGCGRRVLPRRPLVLSSMAPLPRHH